MSNGSGWTIIQTFHKEPIHIDYLRKFNNNAQILEANISGAGIGLSKNTIWRNNDRFIREWISENISHIEYEKVAILEWDVLVTTSLMNIDLNGFYANQIINPSKDKWWMWSKEIPRLESIKDYALGVVPFGVIFLEKKCLQSYIDPEFDKLYNADIFCELRLGSHLNFCGFQSNSLNIKSISWVKYTGMIENNFYHPVKRKIV